jgi:hypothetical protein
MNVFFFYLNVIIGDINSYSPFSLHIGNRGLNLATRHETLTTVGYNRNNNSRNNTQHSSYARFFSNERINNQDGASEKKRTSNSPPSDMQPNDATDFNKPNKNNDNNNKVERPAMDSLSKKYVAKSPKNIDDGQTRKSPLSAEDEEKLIDRIQNQIRHFEILSGKSFETNTSTSSTVTATMESKHQRGRTQQQQQHAERVKKTLLQLQEQQSEHLKSRKQAVFVAITTNIAIAACKVSQKRKEKVKREKKNGIFTFNYSTKKRW